MTLFKCFEQIRDPRKASGRRYKLSSVLKLLLTGLICRRHSLAQIVLWGRSLPAKAIKELGFKGKVPCVATLSNLLRRIEIDQVEEVFGSYSMKWQRLLEPGTHLALDGKTLNASHQEGVRLVHLMSVFLVRSQGVIGQVKMEAGENEMTAALRLLKGLPIEGAIVTGDAIFAQKKSVN